MPNVKRLVVMSDRPSPETGGLSFVGEYEALLAAASPAYDFPDFDENTQATTFYTTGTTGLPKGVYYSHRQLVLHTLVGARVSRHRGEAGPFLARRRLYADHADVPCPRLGLSLGGDARRRQTGLSGTLRAGDAGQTDQDRGRHLYPRRADHPPDVARRRRRGQDGPHGIEDGHRRVGAAQGARQAGARRGDRRLCGLWHVGDRPGRSASRR